MRILYQHRTAADGAEGIHIQEIVEAFQRLGHEVSMHALASARATGEGRPNVWSRAKQLLRGPLFELAAVAYNVADFGRTALTIRRERPDLIYKRHALYDIGVVAAAAWCRVPLVLEANAVYSSTGNQRFERVTFKRLARWCERFAVNHATVVFAVSTPLAEGLRALARDAGDVIVLPNGANPERFTPLCRSDDVRARFGIDGALVVGWSGILRDWHRVDLLIEAVASLAGVHLLIVGDGPDRPRLEACAARCRVSDRVHITGRVPHARMPEYLAAFDIAAAAHDGTGYASPMKVLEYMATGLPVVCPRIPNIEDFIDDGVDGLLFAPEDARSLAAVLARLGGDDALRAQLGCNARAKIERERNWLSNARRVLDEVARRRPGVAAIGQAREVL